jgi:hypothetical protein
LDPAAPPPIDWFALLAIVVTAAVTIYLFRRLARGMNQQDFILLRQVRARGLDPADAHSVDFVLFLATRQAAIEVAEELGREGFTTSTKVAQIQYARKRSKPGEAQEGYLVTANRSVALFPAELAKLRVRLNEVAAARQGIYCGWQVSSAKADEPVRSSADS